MHACRIKTNIAIRNVKCDNLSYNLDGLFQSH
jgi:hypothetical protein